MSDAAAPLGETRAGEPTVEEEFRRWACEYSEKARAEPLTSQDRKAILSALHASPPMPSGPTALLVERYEATVVELEARIKTLSSALSVNVEELNLSAAIIRDLVASGAKL